eukprot:CAMPEP_0177200834 /NCGR_PEP_ID=MMETSP0367-20130122/26432_1 /TAXON_ID=447022 ORGANISM="Scrippsiella hangoei-like, Strain SHHI-4" /NCGR_SAMPLE_ID=MMETSP0367 /ASSEMBLY_ACC=CAM_ASM_000362 /LENGTH=522 /DNA_ID=CAMNT_0018649303 /DNA_START=8 /DNA_END=1576 /DNA_ORIENTATION=+
MAVFGAAALGPPRGRWRRRRCPLAVGFIAGLTAVARPLGERPRLRSLDLAAAITPPRKVPQASFAAAPLRLLGPRCAGGCGRNLRGILSACRLAEDKRGLRRAAANKKGEKIGSALPTSFLNLTKNIVGSNVLFLPDAVRLSHGLPAALVLLGAIGVVSFGAMLVILRCCEQVQVFSYRDLWAKVFGNQSAWIVDFCIALNALIACASYCLLIERFLGIAVSGLFPGSFVALLPSEVKLAAVVLFFIFPLCLKRDLSSLRDSSLVGLVVTVLVAAYVAQDFSVHAMEPLPERGGLTSMEVLSSWDQQPGTYLLQATALFTNAFSVHYNVPKLYGEVPTGERSIDSFRVVVMCAFAFALLTELTFMICGYGRFGPSVESTLLSSYAVEPSSLACWLCMAANIACTYPIVFQAARSSIVSIWAQAAGPGAGEPNRVVLTAALVGLTAVLGHSLDGLSFINAIKGALFLSAIAFVFPGLIHLRLFSSQNSEKSGEEAWRWQAFSKFLILWGAGSATIGLGVLAFR